MLFKKEKQPQQTPNPMLAIGSKKTLVMVYIALTISAVAVMVPVFWLFTVSVKSLEELSQNTWGLPQEWLFSNYIAAWNGSQIDTYLMNSLYSTAVAILVTLVFVCPISFVLARYRFKGNRAIYYFAIAGMMVPIHSCIIPLYTMIGQMDAYNNLSMLGLVYGAFRIPMSIFIIESFMREIPRELDECALIDGCKTTQLFWRIILPLSKDGIVTISVLTVLACWNELLVAMLLISDPDLKTIPSGLMSFITEYTAEYTKLAAGVMIAIMPAIIFYAFASSKIEKGMTAGALKG
ncbi:MAG: carbohydrate ABC transporter permease [Faecalibacterium sp.]